MAGGDRRDNCHPWSFWHVTRGPARVAAQEVGGVFHVEVGGKEGTKSCTDSLDDA